MGDSEEEELVDLDEETQSAINSPNSSRQFYSSKMDLDLLKEIVNIRPFTGSYKEIPKKWDSVLKNLKWTVKKVSIRRRFKLLLEQFKAEDKISLKSTGTEEDYDEKKQLLQDISSLMESSLESNPSIPKSVKAQDNQREKAQIIREAALQSMNPTLSKKKKNSDFIKYVENKHKSESELKEKELEFKKFKFDQNLEERKKDRDLEERKIALQEKQIEMQNKMLFELLKNK